MTARQVLAQLEEEGLVIRRRGLGTFVRANPLPAVLVVDADPTHRFEVSRHALEVGVRTIEAAGPAAALKALSEPGIVLVMTDLRLPQLRDGIEFVQSVRRISPRLPIAVTTARLSDLTDLFNRPEFPIMVLPKPLWRHQLDRTLNLALGRPLPVHEIWARLSVDGTEPKDR